MDKHIAWLLETLGWTQRMNETAIAEKTFLTAVGEKIALVYLTPSDGYNRALRGEYQSEGRNILEPHGVLIPAELESEDELIKIVEWFAKSVEEVVSDSYAARLLRLEMAEKASY